MEKRLDNLATRVSPERATKFKRACAAHGVTVSEKIDDLIGEWVAEQERLYEQLRAAFEAVDESARFVASTSVNKGDKHE